MPRGSKIGERRGGRQRGTPNRRTVLVDRILAIASARPEASHLIDILVKDQKLPADIRVEIARGLLRGRTSRSVGASGARSSADKREAQSPRSRPATSAAANKASLDIVFSIVQDTTVGSDQRYKAASEAAQYLLPKKHGMRRWWLNAPADKYGFAITPQIAAEYRDIYIELRRLNQPGASSLATAQKAAKMRERAKAILHRLQSPCPSLYRWDDYRKDYGRLIYFLRQRESKMTLSEKEDAEEAQCRARFDSLSEGPEIAARQRLFLLLKKERNFVNRVGRRLTWKERVDLRFLRLLYPEESPPPRTDLDDDYPQLRDAPLYVDGNLYPPPVIEEEFAAVPRHVYYHPGVIGYRLS